MALDLATAQRQLDLWIAADAATAKGQSYSIGDMTVTRADARTITEKIDYWQRKVSTIGSGRRGARITRIVPRGS